MKHEIAGIMKKLSSKSILERKNAIKALKTHIKDQHMARLLLQYVAEHDPSYTVRNIARQAFYAAGEPPEAAAWEKHYVFHTE